MRPCEHFTGLNQCFLNDWVIVTGFTEDYGLWNIYVTGSIHNTFIISEPLNNRFSYIFIEPDRLRKELKETLIKSTVQIFAKTQMTKPKGFSTHSCVLANTSRDLISVSLMSG